MESTYFFTTGESSDSVMKDLQETTQDIRFCLLLRLDDCFFYVAKYEPQFLNQLIELQRHREMYFRESREKALKAFRLFHTMRYGEEGKN